MMRHAIPGILIVTLLLDAPFAGAQRAETRGLDSVRTGVLLNRERALTEQLALLSNEIARVRRELARNDAGASNERLFRTLLESLRASQSQLERAIREHSQYVRAEATRQNFGGRAVVARAVPSTEVSTGYVGLTTEARYTVRQTRGGDIRQEPDYPVIVTVAPGSPAFRAGLAAGDTLIRVSHVDGRELEQQLQTLLRPGETLSFQVRRGGKLQVLPVRVAPLRPSTYIVNESSTGAGGWVSRLEVPRSAAVEAGAVKAAAGARGGVPVAGTVIERPERLLESGRATFTLFREPTAIAGARLLTVPHDLAAKLGVEHGLFVLTVGPGTPGARAGLEAGDVIIGTADGALTSVSQLQNAMGSARGRLVLRVMRDSRQRTLTLRW